MDGEARALNESIDCPQCDTSLELTPVERIEWTFTCPECLARSDFCAPEERHTVARLAEQYAESVQCKLDKDLFGTLDRLEDFRLPFLHAVLGEIRSRGLEPSETRCPACGRVTPRGEFHCRFCGSEAATGYEQMDRSGVASEIAASRISFGNLSNWWPWNNKDQASIKSLLWLHLWMGVLIGVAYTAHVLFLCSEPALECRHLIAGYGFAGGAMALIQIAAVVGIQRQISSANRLSAVVLVITGLWMRNSVVVPVGCLWGGLLILRGDWHNWTRRKQRPLRSPWPSKPNVTGRMWQLVLASLGASVFLLATDHHELQFFDLRVALMWTLCVIGTAVLVGSWQMHGLSAESTAISVFAGMSLWLVAEHFISRCPGCPFGPFDRMAFLITPAAASIGVLVGRYVSERTRPLMTDDRTAE